MKMAPSAVTKAGLILLLLVDLPAYAEESPEPAKTRRAPGESPHADNRVNPLYAMRQRSESHYELPQIRSSTTTRDPKKTAPATRTPTSRPPAPVAPATSSYTSPRVSSPTASRLPTSSLYPWKKGIVATVFWIGEQPNGANPTPNCKSSWDTEWMKNFGGYDNPDPSTRADDFRPKAFIPKLNPFYIALPYNDRAAYNRTKAEAPRVIPWFRKTFERPGKTVLKGRWIAIHYNGKVCFAQWEDCGPFNTDDWQYVFGNARPKTKRNKGAGIDVSPAVRDYLGLRSGQKCDWKFVEVNEVPPGPWRKFGSNNDFIKAREAEIQKLRDARERWLKSQGTRRY